MKTAIEWLRERYLLEMETNGDIHLDLLNKLFDKAKEMEKKQAQEYAEFSIHCIINNLPVLEFDGYMSLETFK